MKFLSVLSLLVSSALAGPIELNSRDRSGFSRYEVRIANGTAKTPFSGGAVSIRNNKLGFFRSGREAIFVDVDDETPDRRDSVRITIGREGTEDEDEPETYIALDGDEDDGVRSVVLSKSRSRGAFFEFGEVDDDGYAEIKWVGGGRWLAENTNDDDYELFWWDGESYNVAITFPVELVGRLAAQARGTRD